MKCKLCQSSTDLMSSHIIPEFVYRPSYDNIHRAIHLKANPQKRNYLQKGLREQLLCKSCEQRFSRYESYFAKEWYKKGLLP